MAKAVNNGAIYNIGLRIEGLPPEALVGIEISKFLPRSEIVMQRSSASVHMATQYPNTGFSIRGMRLLPQRLDLDVSEAPEVLALQLAVRCDTPFLFGWLHLPDAALTTLMSPFESLRLSGPGYWALPMWNPLDHFAMVAESASREAIASRGGASLPSRSETPPAAVVAPPSPKQNDEPREKKT